MDIMWNYTIGSWKFTFCFHTQRRTKPESPCLKKLYDCQIQHSIKRLNSWYLHSSTVYSFKLSKPSLLLILPQYMNYRQQYY